MPGVVVVNQPGVYLVDADGNTITVTDGLAVGSAEAILLAGQDGSTARFVRVASDGTVRIDPTGTTTQPVSAASLPLPTGAATEATVATLATAANQTNGNQITIVRSEAKGTSVSAGITSNPIDANTEALHVDGSNVTQPISAAALPLPAGAATSANQTNGQQVSIVRSGNKGTSSAYVITSNPVDANTEALHVSPATLAPDAATETTLAAVLVDTGQIEALLTTIDADTSNLDVALSTRATEATLSGLRSDFNAEDFASETTLAAFKTAFDSRDLATQTTLAAVLAKNTEIDAVLDTIYVRQNDRTQKSQLTDGTNDVAVLDDGGIYRLRVDSKLGAGDAGVGRVKVWDGTQVAEVYTDADSAASPLGLGVFGRDDSDLARMLLTDTDGTLKVATRPQSAPASATAFSLAADSPLELNNATSPDDTDSSVIANGTNFYLQKVIGGAAGDPSEEGSVVEVYWVTSGPTEHLVARVYLLGQTLEFNFPDINVARDGTTMTGDGTNTLVRIKRTRLSNAAQAVDAEIFGYTI